MIKQQQQRGGDDQFGGDRAALVPNLEARARSATAARADGAVGVRSLRTAMRVGQFPVVMLLAEETTLATMIPTAVDGQGHQQGGDDDRLGGVAGLGVGSQRLPSRGQELERGGG